ncbi:LURP-one-like protein (DUF567) [Tasmannia lanceolata]|uniref:LURP-one-like protein (DUF567) n=1 Tax=Tasmannia lanceolata TaxID=3420 RepID=UPI00406388F7
MSMNSSALVSQVNLQIPIDLIISKGNLGLTRGDISIMDANGNLVFKVSTRFSSSNSTRVLLDALKNPLISIYSNQGGWQGFRGESREWKDLIFRVERTLHSRLRTELEAFLVGENLGELRSDFRLKGSPFQRSCTIYKGNSIAAQANPMYRLGKVLVARHKFRLTIYPGFDHAVIVALLVIFFDGGN